MIMYFLNYRNVIVLMYNYLNLSKMYHYMLILDLLLGYLLRHQNKLRRNRRKTTRRRSHREKD